MTVVKKKALPASRRKRAAITPAAAARFFDALRDGHFYITACSVAGIKKRTMERLRDPDSPQFDEQFAEAAEAAHCEGTRRIYERAEAAGRGGSGDWRYFWKKLQVREPDVFANRAMKASATSVTVNVAQSLSAAAEIRANSELFADIMRARELAATPPIAIASDETDGGKHV